MVRSRFAGFSFIACVGMVGAVPSGAQTGPPILGQRGFQPGATYTSDQLETINTVSGDLFYRIPLAALPSGPSGGGASLGLIYNSQIWDVIPTPGYGYSGQPEIHQIPIVSVSGGWHYSYAYSLDVLDKPTAGSGLTCGDAEANNRVLLKVLFPDGSEHILTPVIAAPSGTTTNDGYFPVDPRTFAYTYCAGGAAIASDMTYFTTDGSYARVVVKYSIPVNWLNTQWNIYLRDGSSVAGRGAGTTSLTDSNGNITTITGSNVSNPRAAVTLSDTFGRTLAVQPNTDGTDTVSQSLNGTAALYHWTVSWGNVSITNTAGCSLSGTICSISSGFPVVNSVSLSAAGVALPSYAFGYSATWGELNAATLPSGTSTSYSYQSHGAGDRSFANTVANPITGKTVAHTDGDSSDVWTYNTGGARSIVTAPDGGVTTSYYRDVLDASDWIRGMAYKVVQPNGDYVERVWNRNKPWNAYNASPGNSYVAAELRTSNGQTAVTEFRYDRNGNPVTANEYDWSPYNASHDVLGQVTTYVPGALLRQKLNTMHFATTTATVYAGAGAVNVNEAVADNTSAYWSASAPAILTLPDVAEVLGAGSADVARTELAYGFDVSGKFVTAVTEKRWDSTKGGYSGGLTSSNASVTLRSFLAGGAISQITDPMGVVTAFDYTSGSCGTNLYPNAVTVATGRPESRATDYQYNCGFGAVTRITDRDNGIVKTISLDPIGRQASVTDAFGTALARTTQTTYDDANRNVTALADLDTGGVRTTTVVHYDDQRRERLVQTTDDNGSLGISVETRYRSDTNTQYRLTSSPYRSYSDATMGWKLSTTDTAGRVVSQESFAGQTLPAPWGANVASLGKTTYAYSGNSTSGSITTTTEPDNGSGITVTRSGTADGAGRLTQVTDGSGTTINSYDALDNLTGVTQGVQTRSFVYDSLGRLSSANNPENGLTSYFYNANGNLVKKTDVAGTITCFGVLSGTTCDGSGYDGLNRATKKSYSGTTPQVTYTYDTPCLKGSLCTVQAGSSTGYVYNVLGQVTGSTQTTDGSPYPFTYTYNLRGDRKSVTYPSQKVVNYTLNGRGNAVSAGAYASAGTYAPHGGLSGVALGNGVQETVGWDAGLRWQSLGAAKGTPILSVTNAYAANGNVKTQAATIGSGTATYTQTFGYDNVNRLSSVSETNLGAGTAAWSQTYGFDRYGNRAVTGSSYPEDLATPVSTSQYSTATNRIALTQGNGAMPVDAYSAAGNLTNHPQMGQFAYDAEGRMVSATVGGVTTAYTYDGEGRRVKTVGAAGTRVFVYDAAGALMAEYGTAGGSSGTRYLTVDGLGSTRLVTDGAGIVTSRHDYAPFGAELTVTSNAVRSTVNGFVGLEAGVRQEFTGQPRDSESGLDYFGARYMSSAQGRFTSPDAPFVGQDRANPQSWNLYSYGLNNPLRFTDPTGHDPEEADGAGCGSNLKDCGPTIGALPTTTSVGAQKDRAIGAVKGVLSGVLDLAEMAGAPRSNVDQIKDFFNLYPASQNQKFGGDVAGILGMLLPGGQAAEVEGLAEIASSAKAGLNLKKALASEQQMGEILSGGGSIIAGTGARVALRDAPRLAAQYGGKAEDWVKVGSSNFKAADGAGFEIHAYRNINTGKTVELKTKFQ